MAQAWRGSNVSSRSPDAATAQAYLDAGGYAWNAGIFLFSPRVMLEEFERLAPAIAALASSALEQAYRGGPVIALDQGAFVGCPNEAIDRAVMEKTAHGRGGRLRHRLDRCRLLERAVADGPGGRGRRGGARAGQPA